MPLAAVPADYGEPLLRLAMDAVSVAALVYAVYLPRHRRVDNAVVFTLFNVGVFLALLVISRGEVSLGVGFGLFAVLSIVRLRSSPFSSRELGYFFVALVLALVAAIDIGDAAISALLCAIAVFAAWLVDHPRLARPIRTVDIVLEQVFGTEDALRAHLEERLNAPVVRLDVLEIDYVRDMTRVRVAHGDPRPATPQEILDEPVARTAR